MKSTSYLIIGVRYHFSVSLAIAPGTAAPFAELIPQSLLALYSKLLGGECLIHIDTEGYL